MSLQPELPPETVLHICRLSFGPSGNNLRNSCKKLRALIKADDVAWGHAGFLEHTVGVSKCWTWAVEKWHTEVLRAYILDVPTASLSFALRGAAWEGDTDLAGLLLGAGAVVDSHALEHAASRGHMDLVRTFLGTGLSLDAIAHAISWTVAIGDARMAELLLAHYDGITENGGRWLSRAAKEGNVELARILLAAGANILHDNGSILWEAMENGHVKTVTLLLEAGQRLEGNERRDYLKEALVWAVTWMGLPIVQMLLEWDVDDREVYDGGLLGAIACMRVGNRKGIVGGKGNPQYDRRIWAIP
ncbi:hypothetical protein HDV00_008785 [Rhizophlyctis rosea]|nr:hypothetical protein HDV00_008785 [Rhizophlyctis rosea]